MSWWLIALIAAIFISTLHKLLPRGRDLHLHRLREQARAFGFMVERQLAAEKDPALERCIGYRMGLERCRVDQEFSYRKRDGEWVRVHGPEQSTLAASLLEALPENVRGVDRQSFSVLIHWVEPDRLEPLTQLHEAVQPLRQTPVG